MNPKTPMLLLLENLERRRAAVPKVPPRLELPEETARRVDALKNRDRHYLLPFLMVTCEQCGKQFPRRPSEYKKAVEQGKSIYCSYACHHQANLEIATIKCRDNYRIEEGSGCWIWEGSLCGDGYGKSHFLGKVYRANILSYLLRVGEIPQGMFVCHHCDRPGCINPEHLFLGTPKDNSQDMVKKGRSCKGDRHPSKRHENRIRRNNHPALA